ncbi:MAG TPA: LuxR C-terminal-related transcriptional regulator [Jatrophihabitans sp.]|nr:LuxR C-terminal-related transcriptional regulator [Jatrophihabitans sp.]
MSDGGRLHLPAYRDLFAGRDTERVAVGELLTSGPTRVVTLTGPPGIGKTRLAVASAQDYAQQRQVGAVFVDLVPVRDAARALAEMARAVGIQPRPGGTVFEQLVEVLGSSELLIALDNCEHVLTVGAFVGQLIAACPGLRVLATSRERLRISVEQEFPVPPLPMPSVADTANLEALASNPSVAVLVDRARRTNPRFELTAANAEPLADACVRLEGLPLALELAAARLKVLTPGELRFRLDKRMELLASTARDLPARQRALRAAIAWSHDLLNPAERSLFRRLSVFVGSWTIADAQAVCTDDETEPLGVVESLLDKSLIRRITPDGDEAQFAMLESLRQFAAEQLGAHRETEAVRARHATHFTVLARHLESAIGRPEEHSVVRRALAKDPAGDMTAALEHCLEAGKWQSALALAAALGWLAYHRGEVGAGAAVLEDVLDRVDPAAVESGEDATGALAVAGVLAWNAGALARAESRLRAAVRISGDAGDLRHSSVAYALLGHVARLSGRAAESAEWHRRAAAGFAQRGNRVGQAWAAHDLGLLARDRGDLDEAVDLQRAAIREFRDLDYPWAAAWSGWALGAALCLRGAPEQAAPVLGEALETFHAIDDTRGVAQCFEGLARVACELAAYEAGARLVGAAAALRRRLGTPASEADSAFVHAVSESLAAALGPDPADRLRHSGRTMPLADAIAVAVAVAAGQAPADARPGAVALTRRERQVAALVASGRTNRQIGKALGIAEKTAEVHLQHAMAKLGARSRAEVAAWAAANDLLAGVRDG